MDPSTLSILSIFGANLQRLRKEQGVRVEVMAERAGISTVFLRQLENGVNAPSIDTIVKLCIAWQAQPNCLFKNLVPLSSNDDNDSFVQEFLAFTPREIEMVKATVRSMSKHFN